MEFCAQPLDVTGADSVWNPVAPPPLREAGCKVCQPVAQLDCPILTTESANQVHADERSRGRQTHDDYAKRLGTVLLMGGTWSLGSLKAGVRTGRSR
jgi:hypothetical protein